MAMMRIFNNCPDSILGGLESFGDRQTSFFYSIAIMPSPGCPRFAISHGCLKIRYREQLWLLLGRVGLGMAGLLGGVCGGYGIHPVAAEAVPVVSPTPVGVVVNTPAIAPSPDPSHLAPDASIAPVVASQPVAPTEQSLKEAPTLATFNQSAADGSAYELVNAPVPQVIQFTQATQLIPLNAPPVLEVRESSELWQAISPITPSSVATQFDSSVITRPLDNPLLATTPNPTLANEPTSPSVPATVEARDMDPELGILRLRPVVQPRVKSPIPFSFIGGMGYFSTDNSLASFEPIDDQLFRMGLAFLATPRINAKTIFVTALEGNLIRYGTLGELNYDELRFQVGIRRFITSRMYGEVGWLNQRLYSAVTGDRFLDDHAIFLGIGRQDPLAPKLNLDTFYQVRVSFADPNERSRLLNSLGLALSYDLRSDLRVSLDSQFTLISFTQESREDFYAQFLLKLSYAISKNVSMSIFGGVSTGTSSDEFINFDSSVVGITVDFSLTPF